MEKITDSLPTFSSQIVIPRIIMMMAFIIFIVFGHAQSPFITTWKTDEPGVTNATSIAIPTDLAFGYNYDIDWESDGIYDTLGVIGNIIHDYGTAGIYRVSIRGTFPKILFNNLGDRQKIQSIEQWGDIIWENLNSAFRGCINLVELASDAPDLSVVTSMSGMFDGATSFTGDLSNWDVSNVPFMVSTFLNASSFNGDISGWDVSRCKSIRFMFDGASSFNQDISGWNVDSMTIFTNTFRNATAFDQDLSSWDINQATTMTKMFDNSGMSRKNYDRTLRGWASQTGLQPGVTLGANNLEYCNGFNARAFLTGAPNNWSIVGDTEVCTGASFITTWNTENPGASGSNSIFIATVGPEIYNFDVDWNNDGTFDDFGITTSILHTYGNPGIYEIAIRGEFPRPNFSFNNPQKLISINQWGEIAWKNMAAAFYNCENLSMYNATDSPDLSYVTNMSSMFARCSNFNGDIGNWDVGKITDMSGMFSGSFFSSTTFNQDISSWNVENVIDISSMFEYTASFNQDISGWKVDSVTDMSSMFRNAAMFNQNIGIYNVSNVTDMENMFTDAVSFNQNIGPWNVSKVTNMRGMFSQATAFNQDISSWNVSNVTDMNGMFGSTNFDQNIGNWNVSGVIDMSGMFEEASSFNQDIGAWDVSNVQYMNYMFRDANSFNQDIGSWNVGGVEYMNYMFENAVAFNGDIGGWGNGVSNVLEMSYMFSGASSFNQNIGSWDVGMVSTMQYMFNGATSFNQDIGAWDVGMVNTMSGLFYGATSFNQDIGAWDVSMVMSMQSMFNGATAFNQNIGAWDVGMVSHMGAMFYEATSFDQDIGAWDVSMVNDMSRMLENTYAFDQNLGGWNISNVTNMNDMLDQSGLSASNYDATIAGWSNQVVQPNVNLGANGLIYCNSATGHNTLTNAPNNWVISGDVLDCANVLPCTATANNTWVGIVSDSWFGNGLAWSQLRTPRVCDDVITKAGITITILPGPIAKCAVLEVVNGGEFQIVAGGVLEVRKN